MADNRTTSEDFLYQIDDAQLADTLQRLSTDNFTADAPAQHVAVKFDADGKPNLDLAAAGFTQEQIAQLAELARDNNGLVVKVGTFSPHEWAGVDPNSDIALPNVQHQGVIIETPDGTRLGQGNDVNTSIAAVQIDIPDLPPIIDVPDFPIPPPGVIFPDQEEGEITFNADGSVSGDLSLLNDLTDEQLQQLQELAREHGGLNIAASANMLLGNPDLIADGYIVSITTPDGKNIGLGIGDDIASGIDNALGNEPIIAFPTLPTFPDFPIDGPGLWLPPYTQEPWYGHLDGGYVNINDIVENGGIDAGFALTTCFDDACAATGISLEDLKLARNDDSFEQKVTAEAIPGFNQ